MNLIERAQRLDASALSDALDRLAGRGARARIPRVTGTGVMAGWARTIRLQEGSPPPSSKTTHLGARTLATSGPQDVIVVTGGGRQAGNWGGLLGAAAAVRRIAGVVVDGCVRDLDELDRLGVRLHAHGATPVSARGRVYEAAIDERIDFGDGAVESGDLVLADGSGVVVVTRTGAAEAVRVAEEIVSREREMLRRVVAGEAPDEVFGASYHRLTARNAG